MMVHQAVGVPNSLLNVKKVYLYNIGVDFVMNNGLMFQNALDTNGQFHGDEILQEVFPSDIHLLLHLAAVVHYFDLATKNQYELTNNNRPLAPQKGKNIPVAKPSKPKRTKRIRRGSYPLYDSSDSPPHLNPPARTPRASWVDPFRRRLPSGRKPSFMKVLEADQYGINLQGHGYPQVQYTFVRPHARGGDKDLPKYDYQQNYRAVKTFEALLDSIGL